MLYLREEEMSILSEADTDSSPIVAPRRKWVLPAAALAIGLVAFAGLRLRSTSVDMATTRRNAENSVMFLKVVSDADSAAKDTASNADNAEALDLAKTDSPASAQAQLDLITKAAKDAGGSSAAVASAAFEGTAMAPKDTTEWLKTQSEQQKKISESSMKNAKQAAEDSLAQTKALTKANNAVVKAVADCVTGHAKCVLSCTKESKDVGKYTQCTGECTTSKEKCVDKAEGAKGETSEKVELK